jgi:hypothetical protein
LLPKRLHQDFYNVYSFCRWADDLGDEIGNTAEKPAIARVVARGAARDVCRAIVTSGICRAVGHGARTGTADSSCSTI